VEWIRDGKPTLVGASSGAVAGLVAITPCCGFIEPYAAVLVGLVAGIVCSLCVGIKYKLGFDDSLDVVAVHFVGGWIGSLWIGLFASSAANSLVGDGLGKGEGLFLGGGSGQLLAQFEASGIVTLYSFGVALILGLVIKYTIGFRVKPEVEVEGIDVAEHAESAYDQTPSGGGGGSSSPVGAFAMAGIGGGSPAPEPEPEPAGEKVAG
jgi:Amt family ammonium transporter